MQNPKPLSELLRLHNKRLIALGEQLKERNVVLERVHASVAPPLAAHLVSAGIEHGRLTIGVTSAAWASRLRYLTRAVRSQVGAALGVEITSIRVRIVPAPPARR